MRKRGHPKGADKTVIELLKKKCKEDKPLKKSPKDREEGCPFNKPSPFEITLLTFQIL